MLDNLGNDGVTAGTHEVKNKYTHPKEIRIQSIPTVIVDPHNEVLPFWMGAADRQALLLMHIDYHDDMFSASEFVQPKFKWLRDVQIKRYAKKTHCGSFILPAINLGAVKEVYWYMPQKDQLKTPKDNSTTVIDGQIVWKNGKIGYHYDKVGYSYPNLNDVQLAQAPVNIRNSDLPIILDIDLDAFLCTDEASIGSQDDVLIRLERAREFISSVGKKPAIITIARSQTPVAYVPFDKVNEIQALTISMLNEVFT